MGARQQPEYAFIDFDYHKDTQYAIRDLNGKHNWRVELSHYSRCGNDRNDCDNGSGELGSGSGRRCSQIHPSNRKSPGEHPYLYHLAQTGTHISS